MKTIREYWYLMVVSMDKKVIYHADSFYSKLDDEYRKERMKALVG